MGIEEFTDVFRKSTEYDELDQKFKLVCNKGVQEVLHYITKFGLNNTAITELQAWKKIAEVTDTVEPKFNPADFYHDMRILFKNADLSEPVRGDKTLYDNGYRIVHKSSLPTQPELVEVPEFVGELICWVKKNNAVPSDVISDFYSLAVDEINLPNTLDLEKLSVYFTLACHRFDFEKACIIGYTVKKEQLYYISLPMNGKKAMYCEKFINDNDGNSGFFSTIHTPRELTEAEIKAIDERYWAFAVPVDQEPKLPHEIELSEYLEEAAE